MDALQGAASAVADRFRPLSHDLRHPYAELVLFRPAEGTSGGLCAIVAALSNVLSLPVPPDVAATGCWESPAGATPHLKPVDPASLPDKLRAARRWGYRRVLVVEGQAGGGDAAGITLLPVSVDLGYAVLQIIRHLWRSAGPREVARALAFFDQCTVRSDPFDPNMDHTLGTTGPFVLPENPPLVRRVAHDIRSRALLHAGRTDAAQRERLAADAARNEGGVAPDGWLSHYLRYHQPAHHAILALDQGEWEDDDRDHVQLDRTLEDLERTARLYGPRDGERLAMLYLSNARGRRHDFLGRLNRDAARLERARADYTRFHDQWDDLMRISQQLSIRDGGMHRQHNQAMDPVVDYWELKGELPDHWKDRRIVFWPDQEPFAPEQWASFGFDTAMWFH